MVVERSDGLAVVELAFTLTRDGQTRSRAVGILLEPADGQWRVVRRVDPNTVEPRETKTATPDEGTPVNVNGDPADVTRRFYSALGEGDVTGVRSLLHPDSPLGELSDEQIEDWETKGYTEIRNSRTGQTMRLNKVLYDDTMAHRDELDVPGAASRIDVPWLVVHARDDEAVGVEAAETLAAASDSAQVFEAEGGHTFGGEHPFGGTVPESLQAVWGRTTAFFRTHLSG